MTRTEISANIKKIQLESSLAKVDDLYTITVSICTLMMIYSLKIFCPQD